MIPKSIKFLIIYFAFSEETVKKVFKMAQAPEGSDQGCPRCGAYVYAAEQMLARGRVSEPRINLVIIDWKPK